MATSNRPTTNPELNTVPKLFHAQVERYQNRVAMREKILGLWQEITWRQYQERVHVAAMALLELGVEKGQCISIISENKPEWLYCDIATLCVGGITVGIYTTNASEEVAYVLNDTGSRLLFVEDEEQLDKVLLARNELPHLQKIVVFDMEGLRNFKDPMVMSFDLFMDQGSKALEKNPQAIDRLWPLVEPQDAALIVYTSGTTGRPKGAMISHGNVIWSSRAVLEASPAREGDEILSFLPLCHVAERNLTTFCAMVYGWVVNFAENLETVPENIKEISPDTFFAVPRFWEKFYSSIILRMQESTWVERKVFDWAIKIGESVRMYRFNKQAVPLHLQLGYQLAHFMVFRNLRNLLGLGKTRFATTGAAPIAPDILKFFHAVGIPIREAYGQTESSGVAAMHQGEDIKLGTVGKPLPGVEVKLAADNEILLKGEFVFQGYHGRPELTAEYVKNGWLYTGDVGEIDKDGFLKITDRKKDIIITSGGKNITPSYIENKLKFSPYINDAVVIGDGRKFLSSLIMIDKENVTQFAQDNRIPFTTYKSLCHNQAITELIQQELDKINKTLAQVEKLKKFRLIDVELTSEDPELTATMKLKRKYVSENFSDLITEMY